MGLHICYELRLPRDWPDDHVERVLDRLREHALALKPDRVSPMFRLRFVDLEANPESDRGSFHWFLRITGKGMLHDYDNDTTYAAGPGDQTAMVGFVMNPGAGCESASFGFLRPQATDVGVPHPDWGSWFWHTCCKTQYASAIGDDHLVHCHLMLVALLEECQRLGVDVVVRDETGYWDTRSTDHLVLEVEKMNRVVARVAGALHDAMPAGHTVQGAIFEHPDFERLETPPGGAI